MAIATGNGLYAKLTGLSLGGLSARAVQESEKSKQF